MAQALQKRDSTGHKQKTFENESQCKEANCKKQVQQERYQKVKFNQIHGRKRKMHDTKWTFSSHAQPFEYKCRDCRVNSY